MYLKALELRGFKSFPEKTRLTFEKPITAIVGPNGSGKSNIADALQWVMGEMSSKALRGGKMEDVIFGGTEKRAQVGFAEVTLVLDNSDGGLSVDSDEVEVTRRYFRSGESEYYINRKAVRLRDVNELFMDTGLGRDGYSIIGQGKVDSILSQRSTDRREIFEEAAGISRFRHRKEESERKLERAEEDLLRVNDKISELEMQVEPLRRQSEVAKKYLILRDELRGLEISIWLNELDELQEKNKKLNEDALASSGALERAKAELEAVNKAAEAFSAGMHEKDEEAESVRSEITASDAMAAETESELAVLRTRLGHNKESIERAEEEILRQEGQNSGLEAQIKERRSRVAGIDKELEEKKLELSKLSERADALSDTESENQRRIVELTDKNRQASAELSQKKSELSGLAAFMQEAEDRESAALRELSAHAEKLETTKAEAREVDAAIAKTEERETSGKNVAAGYSMRLKSKRDKTEELNAKCMRLRMDHNALKSRIQILSDMERDYEGYGKAVKTVMREAKRGTLNGIHAPVAELIKTPDKYALAIEVALGAALQQIVVSTDIDGKAAINMLERRDGGRNTFIPLNVTRGSRLNAPGIENEEGFEGIASDLISYDPKYEGVMLQLAGRTAVVKNLDYAVKIARKFSHKFRIVTLNGQVINAGGSMTGGSAPSNSGILSRANELKALQEKESGMTDELQRAENSLETEKRALAAAEYELKTAEDELNVCREELARLRGSKEHYGLLIASIEERAAELKNERSGSSERAAELKARADAVRAEILRLEKLEESSRLELERESGGRDALSEKRRELMAEEAEIKAVMASLSAERETQENAITELDALRLGLVGDKEKQAETIDSLKLEADEIGRSISLDEAKLESRRASSERLRAKLKAITDERLRLEAERTKTEKEYRDRYQRIIDLERDAARIEQKRQAAEMEEKTITDKLWDSYELTRATAREQRLEIESYPAAKRRTGELRRSISALGTPNLGAIEEFERVNTRYTYLTEQRDDIEKARGELLSIIADITGEMKEIFKTEFSRISESFKETFLELFGGGRAALELEDEENILDCGIEIKVQPPGKTLKTITLLSGGEKAFVAIALYYAILKIRPTPFVIMDEIEAALDEANVTRTANYMRKLSDKTQFLVITHRRGTMEEADILFGVTMQEQGVSRVLKMDVEEAEKTIRKG